MNNILVLPLVRHQIPFRVADSSVSKSLAQKIRRKVDLNDFGDLKDCGQIVQLLVMSSSDKLAGKFCENCGKGTSCCWQKD